MSHGLEKLNITYQSSLGKIAEMPPKEINTLFLQTLVQNKKEEIRRGTSLFGLQRDDLVFYLNDLPLRIYGSQGTDAQFYSCFKNGRGQAFY